MLALYCGMREGKLLGLRWSEVDLVAGQLRVTKALQRRGGQWSMVPPKSETSRRALLLPEPVIEALRQHKALQAAERLQAPAWADTWALAFTGLSGEALKPTAVLRTFQAHLRRAGLPVIRLHDLRHGCASILIANGVSLKVVSSILGHSSIQITSDLYGHLFASAQEESAAAITKALG